MEDVFITATKTACQRSLYPALKTAKKDHADQMKLRDFWTDQHSMDDAIYFHPAKK